ncbi:MAG TPA: PadR family transcriptional regulator, partial [Thermodesulfobacteriota bacterium]|nr:PadR family transcriptional regulator [Thermodesulfobacteriota bacterium]
MLERHYFRHLGQERMFHRGDFKYLILDLLKIKPRYGYEVIRELEERSHGFYSPSPGVVYPTLQYLEDTGHVTSR